jgi:hypothetical protein
MQPVVIVDFVGELSDILQPFFATCSGAEALGLASRPLDGTSEATAILDFS